MKQQEFAFAQDKEAWDRQTWSAEFDFAKEKEAFDRYTWQEEMNYKQAQAQFDRQMQIARYNLSVQSQRAQEQLARYEMEKAAEAAKYESLIKLAEQDLKGAQAFVAKTNIDYEKDEKAYYNYLKQAKVDGYADKYTAKYFGVSTGTPISSQSLISAIMNKASYLDSWKAELGYVAESLAMDANALLNIDDFATKNAKLGRMTK
jgi:multidrug resistance efflux pump